MKKQQILKNIDEITARANLYKEYECDQLSTWCGGCGNYGIQNAVRMALILEKIPHDQVVLCYDIGCNGNGADKQTAYTIHGLHGRVISLAAGISIANPALTVIASAGDGATFSEGIGHLIHAVRSNYNITFIHHNNLNYALTTGQASATTPRGYPMNGSPDGVVTDPINTLELVLSLNPAFVARGFSGDPEHMTEMIRAGIKHQGFSFIEVLQVCPTYNKATPQSWYWERLRDVESVKGYNRSDIWGAKKAVADMEKEILTGILYENPQPPFISRLIAREGIKTAPIDEVRHYDVTKLMGEFE